jgi:hypothetical protein
VPGIQGLPGPPGASGTSHLYIDTSGGDLTPTGVVVGSITVPAGSYLVTATTQLLNRDSSTQAAHCDVNDGVSFALDSENVFDPGFDGNYHAGFITLQGLDVVSAPTTITFSCYSFKTSAEPSSLSAIPFDAVN